MGKKCMLNGKLVRSISKLPSILRIEEGSEKTNLPKPKADGAQKGLELSNKTNTLMVGVKTVDDSKQ